MDHLRDGENFSVKWQYVRENPGRAGLVSRPEDWPISKDFLHCTAFKKQRVF